MDTISTYSLSKHGRLFSVADHLLDYLFIQAKGLDLEEPYRADSYGIGFLRKGKICLNAGLERYDIIAPAIITLGPSVIRSFSKKSEKIAIDIILFKESFLLEAHPDPFFLAHCIFFETIGQYVLYPTGTIVDRLEKIYGLILSTESNTHLHQAGIIRSYIFALIYEIDALHAPHKTGLVTSKDGFPLFEKYRQLIGLHYFKERKLDFYARLLHITPKSLSTAIKKQTGRPAGKWIDDTIILEAKVLLQNKMLTVSQVSSQLNFINQSVFGKFFKTATGLSPMEYRRNLI